MPNLPPPDPEIKPGEPLDYIFEEGLQDSKEVKTLVQSNKNSINLILTEIKDRCDGHIRADRDVVAVLNYTQGVLFGMRTQLDAFERAYLAKGESDENTVCEEGSSKPGSSD